MGFASCLCYCSTVIRWRPTKLCTMFGRLLGRYTIYTFLVTVAPDGILAGAKFTLGYVQVLRSPILAALLHGTPAAGVSQTLRRGTKNGIPELLQRTTLIFGWAAITLGIGPHSSYLCTSEHFVMYTQASCVPQSRRCREFVR